MAKVWLTFGLVVGQAITQKMGNLCHVENIPYKAWDWGLKVPNSGRYVMCPLSNLAHPRAHPQGLCS
jgi:hypothetical protein